MGREKVYNGWEKGIMMMLMISYAGLLTSLENLITALAIYVFKVFFLFKFEKQN